MYQSYYLIKIIILLTIYSVNILQGCMKSSMFYRTPIRTRSHVFLPGEYQPKQLESNLEASGPLDTRDFHYQFPNKRLVRVDSPYIRFDSEEARWMTKGCRDRLIKLSTQIHNTWAKQEVILRVIRSWVKPPPNYKLLPQEDNLEDNHEDSPLLYEKNFKPESGSRDRDPVFAGHPLTVFSGQKTPPFVPVKSRPFLDAPVIDMTPEMVDGEFIQIPTDSNKFGTQSKGLKFHNFIPSSKSISTQTNRWPSIKNDPNYVTHLSSLPRSSSSSSSFSSYPTQNPHSYQSPSSPSSGHFYNPNKISSSLTNSSYNSVIRLPRNVLPTQSNNKLYHLKQIINKTEPFKQIDRSLHKLVERSVNTIYTTNIHRKYPHSNQNYFKKIDNKFNELRMEEFHYAGRAVDMELITQHSGRPHNFHLHLGVLAQIAYYVAQFDWCFFNRAGHVHCSVKPDSIVTSQWFGCFPGESKVIKSNGHLISMKDLQIGDYIITENPFNGLLINTLVFGFLDRDEHAWSPLVKIQYQINSNQKQQQNIIYLTEDHLIFIDDDNSTQINNSSMINKKAVYASSVKQGQTLLVYNNRNNSKQLIKAEIISVEIIKSVTMNQSGNVNYKTGLYAPITDTGTMIVDNVLVSCFAYISSHQLASFIIWPWKLIYMFLLKIDMFLKNFQNNQYDRMSATSTNDGVPWFIQWTYKLTHQLLPESHFYKNTHDLT
ncbi:unnamed protein product [Schistosoma turkestanicum]|nr:unnamed protein product [Schistosoma turkestanicum]